MSRDLPQGRNLQHYAKYYTFLGLLGHCRDTPGNMPAVAHYSDQVTLEPFFQLRLLSTKPLQACKASLYYY